MSSSSLISYENFQDNKNSIMICPPVIKRKIYSGFISPFSLDNEVEVAGEVQKSIEIMDNNYKNNCPKASKNSNDKNKSQRTKFRILDLLLKEQK